MALGRGLSSLIQQNTSGKKIDKKEDVLNIDIKKVQSNPYQPRKKFDQKSLNELADSIKKHGILQPIIVSSIGDGKYQVIAGERRLRASKLAGLKKIPAIVKGKKTNKENLELAILENIQREDLTPIERALSYKQLADEFGMTHAQIAQRVGKGRVAVTNTIRLLDLPDKVKEALEKGQISENHARAILALPTESQRVKLLEQVKTQKLSARNTEVAARAMLKRPLKSEKSKDPFLKDCMVKLEAGLGTKVTIKPAKHVSDGGEVIIKYFSNEDLKNLVKRVSEKN